MQHQCASNTVKKCPHDAPNRDLRRGFLGNCWVYDIRSSVIKWKMRFAWDYLTSIVQTENDDVRRSLLTTLCHIEDRKGFMGTSAAPRHCRSPDPRVHAGKHLKR